MVKWERHGTTWGSRYTHHGAHLVIDAQDECYVPSAHGAVLIRPDHTFNRLLDAQYYIERMVDKHHELTGGQK
jgi:hypothetical protein